MSIIESGDSGDGNGVGEGLGINSRRYSIAVDLEDLLATLAIRASADAAPPA